MLWKKKKQDRSVNMKKCLTIDLRRLYISVEYIVIQIFFFSVPTYEELADTDKKKSGTSTKRGKFV